MTLTKQDITAILEAFEVVDRAKPALVTVHNTTHPMPHNTVTLLTYGKHRYMILHDDSAAHQPEYVLQQFKDAMFIPSEGKLVPNPVVQTDGEKFALGYDEHEYYLWSYDKDE